MGVLGVCAFSYERGTPVVVALRQRPPRSASQGGRCAIHLLSPLHILRDSGAEACDKTCPKCLAARQEHAEVLRP
jgi:hypothetical protein